MKCQSCGFENPTGSAFCEECGNSLQPACPACGSEIRPGAKFCRSCGANLGEAVAAQPVAAAPAAQAGVSPIPAFADGRYQVKKFLGEGGKKLVYLALDTKLDRDVAFALIKTDGLD